MTKVRLDILLCEKEMVESRSQAQRMVMAGQVRVNGQVVLKPSIKVEETSDLFIEQMPPFVSRGGEKLEAALNAFGLHDLNGMVCADIGASTGGFTDCLLQHGAIKVYAVDVGYGVLHWKLRNDPRVISMERTNARHIQAFSEAVDFISIDASFISLKLFLPLFPKWIKPAGGKIVALIKPQFEAGRVEVARGEGVVRDTAVHLRVVQEILDNARKEAYGVLGLIQSPLKGPKGNTEFLCYLEYPDRSNGCCDLMNLISSVFETVT